MIDPSRLLMNAAIQQGMQQGMQKQSQGQGNFLFGIPRQQGPPTDVAVASRHWFIIILVLQTAAVVVQFVLLNEILGGITMIITVLQGLYAWHQDMNITYICLWGGLSVVNGCMSAFNTLIGVLLKAITLQLFTALLSITVPLVYFVSAAFAWHLLVDYRKSQGAEGNFYDPFADYAGKLDPTEKLPFAGKFMDQADGYMTQAGDKMFGGGGVERQSSGGWFAKPQEKPPPRPRQQGYCC
eukprot:TRINITY_DN169_c7_g1_i1.p1 TRINITY_DN169_c7_g1~~TRINITY_DN169_c7_g1_i1.p1  ORF type:complete len:240 (-),score=39.05 TRINITY_DN169_c7_g1_i1:255-974(-)